jgi:hypothetical protein
MYQGFDPPQVLHQRWWHDPGGPWYRGFAKIGMEPTGWGPSLLANPVTIVSN